ncbi:hypothetical protein ElyMa_000125400 [Elysia marginata]|uniref:Uncharacterized protein n=1 Tax=Elysia marginata TaxID=1093978 RepID=A0AAV4ENQ7_9GAST|nr:hypothetical protein ElyMa_000125400 [Elysia marginata]
MRTDRDSKREESSEARPGDISDRSRVKVEWTERRSHLVKCPVAPVILSTPASGQHEMTSQEGSVMELSNQTAHCKNRNIAFSSFYDQPSTTAESPQNGEKFAGFSTDLTLYKTSL